MNYSIQWIATDSETAVVREHEDGQGFGDPYTWVITVEKIGTLAKLHGTLGAPRRIKQLAIFLRSQGFTEVSWVHAGRQLTYRL